MRKYLKNEIFSLLMIFYYSFLNNFHFLLYNPKRFDFLKSKSVSAGLYRNIFNDKKWYANIYIKAKLSKNGTQVECRRYNPSKSELYRNFLTTWKNGIYSYEGRFCLGMHDDRTRGWRRSGERWNRQALCWKERSTHCSNYDMGCHYLRFPSVEIVEPHIWYLIYTLPPIFIKNVPSHVIKFSIDYLEVTEIILLSKPSKCPDLSPIGT